ncbi:alanine--tRNA ligase, partial [bacterium]
MLSTDQIRKKFLDFFAGKKHTIRPSSSVIPANDPSLLFTSAGMVPFKDMFLGNVPLEYTRAVSIQKCVRTSDIENVGYTNRHLTFFEMMGNFSFGDYFKEEAINWAWEFFTEVLKLPKEKLYATIYKDDNESFEIWKKIIAKHRIYKLGQDTNFWSIGHTGPCGPCSEIIFDMGKELGCGKPECGPGCDCDRYMEIWNLVFTQFDKQPDCSLKPLPQKNIDTGMGLERLACVVQGVHSPYETDVFKAICVYIRELTGKINQPDESPAFKIISDHARTVTLLLADGVFPSNEGRGYVLKRLIRRAVRQGYILGLDNFLHKVSAKVIEVMKNAYPELVEKRDYCIEVLMNEEKKFRETLEIGLKLLDELKEKYKKEKIMPGNELFKLFDTYGMPLDIARDIAHEQNYKIDEQGFNKAMQNQRMRAKKSVKGWEAESEIFGDIIKKYGTTDFVGYDAHSIETKVTCILKDNEYIKQADIKAGDIGVILEKTPFYGESGGQKGDKGVISVKDKKGNVTAKVEIDTANKPVPNLIIHYGRVIQGTINIKDNINAQIDVSVRESIRKNHSAAHILQAVLRKNLGTHVEQKGSEVTENGFRFDFTHTRALERQELNLIEKEVNNLIGKNYPITAKQMSLDDAVKSGALAFFGEKYGQTVRVCSIADDSNELISTELCGGTHCKRTGDIGLFKIISESSIAGGIRRIEGKTGLRALEWVNDKIEILKTSSSIVKAGMEELPKVINDNQKKIKSMEKQIQQLKYDIMKSN